jgi:glycosyltransferase involved in cell wall biosynthesis
VPTPTAKLSYAVITPARDEAENLPRLANALSSQTMQPDTWLIVENGSSDSTLETAHALARETAWVHVLVGDATHVRVRGAPIVRALTTALERIDRSVDIVVNVDADVSFEADYFERLLAAFAADPLLGIASGSAYELDERGAWRQRYVTGGTVWGATRAYRRLCLDDVLPFEERHGWDGLDQLKARSRGWHTRTLVDLPFRHHRPEGSLERSSREHWRTAGESAHYMGYRPWYLALRAVHQARRDRRALWMIWGFARAAAGRRPRWPDERGRAVLRSDQSFRTLARRRAEALGRSRHAGGETPREPAAGAEAHEL